MIRFPGLILAFLLASVAVALAQFPPQPSAPSCPSLAQGTPEERAACGPDVSKRCQAELTNNKCDVMAILSCLQRNRQVISPACQRVLSSNGQ